MQYGNMGPSTVDIVRTCGTLKSGSENIPDKTAVIGIDGFGRVVTVQKSLLGNIVSPLVTWFEEEQVTLNRHISLLTNGINQFKKLSERAVTAVQTLKKMEARDVTGQELAEVMKDFIPSIEYTVLSSCKHLKETGNCDPDLAQKVDGFTYCISAAYQIYLKEQGLEDNCLSRAQFYRSYGNILTSYVWDLLAKDVQNIARGFLLDAIHAYRSDEEKEMFHLKCRLFQVSEKIYKSTSDVNVLFLFRLQIQALSACKSEEVDEILRSFRAEIEDQRYQSVKTEVLNMIEEAENGFYGVANQHEHSTHGQDAHKAMATLKPDPVTYSQLDFERDQIFPYQLKANQTRITDEELTKTFQTIVNLSNFTWTNNPNNLPNKSTLIKRYFEQFWDWATSAQDRSYSIHTVNQVNKTITEWQQKLKSANQVRLLPTESCVAPDNQQPCYGQSSSQYHQQAMYEQEGKHHQYKSPEHCVRLQQLTVQPQPQPQPDNYSCVWGNHIQPVYGSPNTSQKVVHTPVIQQPEPILESTLPSLLKFDPNLICHKCRLPFREGQLPEYRHHIDNCQQETDTDCQQETDTERLRSAYRPSERGVYVSDGINSEINKVADKARKGNQEEEYLAAFLPYDPYLVCHKCQLQFREGQLPEYRTHIDHCRV